MSRRRHRARLGVVVIAMVVLWSSCSSAAAGFGPGAEAAFVASCAPDHSESARSLCVCVYRRLESQVSFDRYQEIDRELQRDPGATPIELKQAVDACNRERQSNQSSNSGQ